jgi:hypothetical protein
MLKTKITPRKRLLRAERRQNRRDAAAGMAAYSELLASDKDMRLGLIRAQRAVRKLKIQMCALRPKVDAPAKPAIEFDDKPVKSYGLLQLMKRARLASRRAV